MKTETCLLLCGRKRGLIIIPIGLASFSPAGTVQEEVRWMLFEQDMWHPMVLKCGSSPLFPPNPRVLPFHLSRGTFKPPLTLFRFRLGTPVRLGSLRSSMGQRRITWASHQITRFALPRSSKHHRTPI